MGIVEAAVRQELIVWAKVRFGARVDEEAIFGDVCRRIATLLVLREACPHHGPLDKCAACAIDVYKRRRDGKS